MYSQAGFGPRSVVWRMASQAGWIASRAGFGPRAVVWSPWYRRITAKNWSEWRWAFSFYGIETCLLLRIMYGTKRLNDFSDYTRSVRYFRSARVYLLLLFIGKILYGLKARAACTVAKAADIKWRKMQWRICAKCRQWQS